MEVNFMALSDILRAEKETAAAYDPRSGERAFGDTLLKTVLSEIDRRRKAKELEASRKFEMQKLDKILEGRKERGQKSERTLRDIILANEETGTTKKIGKQWGLSDIVFKKRGGQGGLDKTMVDLHRYWQQQDRAFKYAEENYLEDSEEYKSARHNRDSATEAYWNVLPNNENISYTEVQTMLETTIPEQNWWQKFRKQKPQPITTEKKIIVEKGKTRQTEKQLDKATAIAILKEAGGDVEKARELARQRGYKF